MDKDQDKSDRMVELLKSIEEKLDGERYVLSIISDKVGPKVVSSFMCTPNERASLIKGLMSVGEEDEKTQKANEMVRLDVMNWCTELVHKKISKHKIRN